MVKKVVSRLKGVLCAILGIILGLLVPIVGIFLGLVGSLISYKQKDKKVLILNIIAIIISIISWIISQSIFFGVFGQL
jgi:hypothetical protein